MPASRVLQKFILPLVLPDLVFSKTAQMSRLKVAVLFTDILPVKCGLVQWCWMVIFYALCIFSNEILVVTITAMVTFFVMNVCFFYLQDSKTAILKL